MNNLVGQKFLVSPNMKKIHVANDLPAPKPIEQDMAAQNADFIQFQQFMRGEKRQAFWGGVALMGAVIFTITLAFIAMSASGVSFMTCQEFGETFTCRLGGM